MPERSETLTITPAPPPCSHAWLPHAAALALFAVLALWAAFPLWLRPGRTEFCGDPLLNAWILAWDHHSLLHHPFWFFHADVFWPQPLTLAYGEHMLTQALLALPFRLFVSHPAAIHNLSLIQSFFLSAAAAYALAFHYFRRPLTATVAGLAYGFAAYRFHQAWHIQLTHGEFLPLMILGFERMLARGSRADWWLLCLAALGQWLTSWYWAVFSFWCMVPYMAVRLIQMRNAECGMRNITGFRIPHLLTILSPLLAAVAITLPMAYPYYFLKSNRILFRPPEVAVLLTPRLHDYLSVLPRSWIFSALGLAPAQSYLGSEMAMFPGLFLTGGLLAALALACRPRRRAASDFPLRLWVCLTLFLLSLTFGSHLEFWIRDVQVSIPMPLGLLRWFPMTDQMRVPGRWMLPALLGLALVAAAAWDRLRTARWHAARPLAAGAFALLLVESAPRPSPYVDLPASPPEAIQRINRFRYPAPVFILPIEHDRMMLEAAWLQQPIMNGSNGYFPPAQLFLMTMLADDLPNPAALKWLRGIGIRFILINHKAVALRPAGWTTEERIPQILKGLPPTAMATRMGDYTLIDLGPMVVDSVQAYENFTILEKDYMNRITK